MTTDTAPKDIQEVRRLELGSAEAEQNRSSKKAMAFNPGSVDFVATGGVIGFVLLILTFGPLRNYLPNAQTDLQRWAYVLWFVEYIPFWACLGWWFARYLERKRIAAIPAAEREWHTEYMQAYAVARNFNDRLEALHDFDEIAKPEEKPGLDVVLQRAAEREEYAAALEPFLQEIASRERAKKRKATLQRLEEVVSANTDGRSRDTKDLSELVYVSKVLGDAHDREIRVLTTVESPNEEEFAALDNAEADEAQRRHAQ